MQSNGAKTEGGRLRPVSGASRQIRKVQTRKVPYRVGYSWSKGGRLKELRIRHLARKFLKIWIRNTFGRLLPHKAKSYYDRVLLRRAFGGWRDEWWTARHEWSLTLRAECHYRYYLCNLTFHSWRMFMLLQREKKNKLQMAQSHADRQRMRLVWDRWEVFIEVRRLKMTMLESAFEQNRLATLHSAWNFWQTRFQQHQDLHALEDQALKQQALILQRKAWLQWKGRHKALCCQKKKESTASLHFILKVKRKTLHQWMSYVSSYRTQKESQAKIQLSCYLHLVRRCWSIWRNALQSKWRNEDRMHAAGQLAIQSTQRRALEHWKTYVVLCKGEAEVNQMAIQHHQHHLLVRAQNQTAKEQSEIISCIYFCVLLFQTAGLKGLSLNIILNKTHRLNNNIALQHYYQNMMRKFWKLWQDHLEEAEDKSFQQLTEMAQTKYSTSLLSSCFHSWREKFSERRHMQELEHRADIWFAEHLLPQYFKLWVQFTLQKRCHTERRHKAEVYNQQRQYTWVFYTWWGRSERHKEQMLSQRMAILHEERCQMQRAWDHWRQRTVHRLNEEEKQKASDGLYRQRLLHKVMTQWKNNSTEIRERRNQEQQACHRGDLQHMKWALDRWKKFVQRQKVKKGKLEEAQHYHEAKLLKHTFMAWKTHHLQMSQIYRRTEELHKQKTQCFLRTVMSVWKKNAGLQAEAQLMEKQAQNHLKHFLQLKVFLAWREATKCAVSQHYQQEEAVKRLQRSINQGCQLRHLRQWRRQTRETFMDRLHMEKARQHHNFKLLSKAMKMWNMYHFQHRKHKVMKRQGILLLKLKLNQTYFEKWKIKLQHRQREVYQTEQALWHWSLTLQAKVLYGWRLWVSEQRRRQEQAARAALVYRNQLLKEGVTRILTYAAHMNDLTASITQQTHKQRSHHLQRVVKRCAMHWKQRALCKPQQEQVIQKQPSKKTVTFSLTAPGLTSADSVEQEDEGVLCKLLPTHTPRRQPRCSAELFESPLMVSTHEGTHNHCGISNTNAISLQKKHHAVPFFLHPSKVLVCTTHQSTAITKPSEPLVSGVDSSQGIHDQDLLLPPSAFLPTGFQNMLGKTHSLSSRTAPAESSHQFVKHKSKYPATPLQVSSEETECFHGKEELTGPTATLTRELLSIQQDMKSFQEDRKRLRGWQKLKEILKTWLQTTGEDEQMDKDSVCQELLVLEERIESLSSDLGKRRPVMLLHSERIQHLQSVLHTLGVTSSFQKIKDMECNHSPFTT
ncbi:protein SFI1 homolog isoform X2 [Echeneis naucrates]|nr:protein SFI1 homolog isoform X2 [Echeneis naucrates]XP_029357540.1 protein SFI1 homolog isoform X2 [Echeneis naucrates]XP_029357542.1 protein SFI1 homolog isoform X2 [Echeneis naucrates]